MMLYHGVMMLYHCAMVLYHDKMIQYCTLTYLNTQIITIMKVTFNYYIGTLAQTQNTQTHKKTNHNNCDDSVKCFVGTPTNKDIHKNNTYTKLVVCKAEYSSSNHLKSRRERGTWSKKPPKLISKAITKSQ